MFKQFLEFLGIGFGVILSYFLYFFLMFITTFIIGVPIAFGIRLINDAVDFLYKAWVG